MIDKGTISGKIGKTVLVAALKSGKTIKDVVADQGLT
jgi:Asp-tRNA(Asn)/Glu-tRNA(Gln) amidotransferase B subunit